MWKKATHITLWVNSSCLGSYVKRWFQIILLKYPQLYTSMVLLQPPSPPHRSPPVCPQQRPGTEPGLCGLGSPWWDPAGPHPLDAGAGHDTVSWGLYWTLRISDITCSYGHISALLCRYVEGGTRYNFTKLDQLIELLWINGLRPGGSNRDQTLKYYYSLCLSLPSNV